MQHSRAHCKIVYSSLRCRQIFCQRKNAAIRKQKPIREVIRRHHLAVSYFSEQKLTEILQYLLQEGVFESRHNAKLVFPELFSPPIVQQEAVQVIGSSTPHRDLLIMEEQKTWLRRQAQSGWHA